MTTVNDQNVGDFTNNLASDIGPLLALFGEKMTIQYLSESTTFLDYFIFAMAPIGIITGIVSTIRLCGHASIRAFIGRSQEGEGAVEAELCTSTSRDVCELFTKGGVQRVLGRPSILELVYVDHNGHTTPAGTDPSNNEVGLFLSRNYFQDRVVSENQEWKRETTTKNAAFAPNPNLSLNVGVRNQPPWVFWTIAATGLVLQTGILVLAGVGVWILGWNLNEAGGSAKNYAPSMYITGTTMLCFGMWCCAALIGQTTDEIRFKRVNHDQKSAQRSRLLWLQPGPQVIGDQSFDPFAYFEDTDKDPLRVWNSSSKSFPDVFELYTVLAILITLAGFIIQFIGLRGMKGWVSLAQLGITIIMSLLRGLLRIKRLGRHDNKLQDMPDLVAGHELDWLAFSIAAKKPDDKLIWHITGWHQKACEVDGPGAATPKNAVSKSFKHGKQRNDIQKSGGKFQSQGYSVGNHLFELRVRLAHLTGNISFRKLDDAEYQKWEDEYVMVRAKARQVGNAIRAAARRLNKQPRDKHIILSIRASCSSHGDHQNLEEAQSIEIILEPPQAFSTGGWRLDSALLEAALGLWIWGMTSDERLLEHDNNGASRSQARKVKPARIMAAGIDNADWNAEVNVQSEMDLWLGSSAINFREALLVCDDTRSCGIATLFASGKVNAVSEFTSLRPQEKIHMQEEIRRFCGWSHIHGGLDSESDASSAKDTTSGKTGSNKLRIQYSDLALADVSLLDLCAQELFIALMLSLVDFLPLDETLLSEDSGRVRLENDSVKVFVSAFQETGLGISSDAMLCVVPALRQKLLPLDSERLLFALQKSADSYRQVSEWERAETTLLWACKRFAVPQKQLKTQGASQYFTQALMAAAELYRWSLAQSVWDPVDPNAASRRSFGIEGIKSLVATYGGQSAECEAVLERYRTVVQKFEEIGSEKTTSESRSKNLITALFDRDRASALFGLCFMTPQLFRTNDYAVGSVLPLAIRNDWSEVVKALFEMKVNVNSVCLDKRTLLNNKRSSKGGLSGDRQSEDELSEDIQEEARQEEDEHSEDPVELQRLDDERHPDDGRTALSYVAELGYSSYFRPLVDRGAAIDEPAGRHSQTPLSYASKNGHFTTVKLLLESGYVNVDKRNSAGKTSLAFAAEYGHVSIVQELLLRGAEVDTQDDAGWTPLMFASFNGHISVVEQLLANGADPNIKNAKRNSAHLLAAGKRYEKIVETLLNNGADIDSIGMSADHMSALSIAAASGDLSMVRLLLDRGADIESQPQWEEPLPCRPLYHAITHRHYDVVQLLIERGANPSYVQWESSDTRFALYQCDTTPIFKAILNGDKRTVELLLDAGADIEYDARNLTKYGGTPLLVAIEQKEDEIVRLLIDRGAKMITPRGGSALEYAARAGLTWLVELSLESPVEVEHMTKALKVAAPNDHTDIVRMLVERCRQLDLDEPRYSDLKGQALEAATTVRLASLVEPLLEKTVHAEGMQRALEIAALKGYTDIVRTLVERGGQLDLNEPCYVALREGHIDCARTLLELGAPLDARNESGLTMFHRIVDYNGWCDKKAALQFLIEQGASTERDDGYAMTAAWTVERILKG